MTTEQHTEELNNLQNIRHEWTKKRDALRLEEAKQSDINNLHAIQSKLKDIGIKIDEIDTEILSLENKLSTLEQTPKNESLIQNEISENDNIAKAIEVLKQEGQSLNFNSTKKDYEKIHDLKSKIFDEIFKDLNKQLDFVSSKKELMYSSVLFDKIYTAEILDSLTEQTVQQFRHDTETYKWYDRSIIVSALSLSLINHKFDNKKANLLLDFVTDFEVNVYERALTGLIIAIIYQKNRSWLRATSFITRLESLKNNEKIQEGVKIIDLILKHEVYKDNIFNPNLFKLDLFNNPMNCFLPFYENNEVLKSALDNADKDFDIEGFQKFLDFPLMDSYKYALCIALSDGKLEKVILKKRKAIQQINSLLLSDYLSPFQNIISEYYFFFNNYPKKLKDDVFKTQLLLSKTELRKHVLNKVMQLLLEANTLYDEKFYSEAINKYLDILKIDNTHEDTLWQLGDCYSDNKNEKEALNTFLKLEDVLGNQVSIKVLLRIASCLNSLKDFVKSNEYCNKIEQKNKDLSCEILCLKADNYNELHDISNVEKCARKAEEKILDEDDMFDISSIYYLIEKNDDAIRIIKRALQTKPKNERYLIQLGSIYENIFEWELAISTLKEAGELNKKDDYINIVIGRCYLFSGMDINESKKLLEKGLKHKNDLAPLIFGNLGHFYFIQSQQKEALEHYIKCMQLLKDKKDFEKRMNMDLKFMRNIGIEEKDYNEMISKVLEHPHH
ncbi:MAG: hypothetical protein V4556_13820 [Bacteroidota bacterium]